MSRASRLTPVAAIDTTHRLPVVDQLLRRYQDVRDQSRALIEGLSDEDCCAQSMPDASPAKWHLAHTTWFFETFILENFEQPFAAFDPAFRVLFNSYYNGVGDRHARPRRGLLTRPPLDVVLNYRADVDRRIAAVLQCAASDSLVRMAELIELGLHHEQQHQELLVTDIKHLFMSSPLFPAYRPQPDRQASDPQPGWTDFNGGLFELGHDGNGFGFDNEFPRHRVFIEPFRLATDLVTNREYLEFVDAGGYRDPAYWLSEGWDWRTAQDLPSPLCWFPDAGQGWREFTLHGLVPLQPDAPVNHLSYYEADAYARWRGARLPSEAEWELAARSDAGVLRNLHGSRWQWTASSYGPYPGYAPAPGAIGEYNGKFMVNQYVLRGSSSATPDGHARHSYRNFFPAGAQWQFTGLRLAQSR